MRIRLTFAKTPAMRYTSHLDLHRTWERTLRRARLPLAYTQGFSPHPRINLASALPLGCTGEAEIVDIWLEEALSIPEIQSALQAALPPGLQVIAIREVELRAPSLQTELVASEYTITLLEAIPDLEQRCHALLGAASLPRRRRDKDYDLRPLILALETLPPDEQCNPRLFMRLAAQQSATGRPEEVISALGIATESMRAHRTSLVFELIGAS